MRRLLLTGILICGGGIFYAPAYELARLSFRDPLYSHTLLIPLVSLYIFWTGRKSIFSETAYSPFGGTGLLAISLLIVLCQKYWFNFPIRTDTLAVLIASMIIWVLGGVLLVCGRQSVKRALFPLLFLAFMIPIPTPVLDPMVRFLQVGSAEAAKTFLQLLNVPIYSKGVFISLPGVTVEVAKACSGIRSAMALMILCTVASYLYLNANWRRIILVIAVIPITIIKNGMRITTLALLGSYVDMHYLTDSVLHSSGGKPFFIVAIMLMTPIFWMLKRSETKTGSDTGIPKGKQRIGGDVEMAKDIQLV